MTTSRLDPARAADLVERIVAGDASAEAELVERSLRPLRLLARRVTRTEADAEDLVQETQIAALEKIRRGDIREPERLAGFLRALLKNRAVQTYRRRHHTAETASEAPPDAADERPGPLGDALERERLRVTRRLLDELNVARDREILFRYYIAEESSEGICRTLGLDADHFYRVLHRARQRFAKLWRQQAPRELHGIVGAGLVFFLWFAAYRATGGGR
ncbi:MAG: sigma-70 family RNA polymerase sigma factor [Acidobacteriota bacterium]